MRFPTGWVGVFIGLIAHAAIAQERLINGQKVPAGTRTETTWVVAGSSVCTAVFIGPKVAMTAAHCVAPGSTTIVLDRGKRLYGTALRHPKYATHDVDLAVVLLEKPRVGAPYASIAHPLASGELVDVFGQGCVLPEGTRTDGIMRWGLSQVSEVDEHEVILSMENGVVACFGDSGGPVFRHRILGEGLELGAIISKGDVKDTSYATRVDTAWVHDFLTTVTEQGYAICGVDTECDSGTFTFDFPPFFENLWGSW